MGGEVELTSSFVCGRRAGGHLDGVSTVLLNKFESLPVTDNIDR